MNKTTQPGNASQSGQPLLQVENLRVSYYTYAGEVQSVRGISFSVEPGEVFAIIGESGCGKSVTARSIMSLIKAPGKIKEGSKIIFNGENILEKTEKELYNYRGGECSMIFQDALVALNPTMRIGRQIIENLNQHGTYTKEEANAEAIRLLEAVGIPHAVTRIKQYPFEFSGGMRQRAMIAIAIACNPKLIIADEPTTALDVTIQAQIMELLKELRQKHGSSIVLITHDFGVVAGSADKVAVMYAGKIVEAGNKEQIFYKPRHPYTWALLRAVPQLEWKSKQILNTIRGTPPDLIKPPQGCPFSRRCDFCMNACTSEEPPRVEFEDGHATYCWLYDPAVPEEIKQRAEEVAKGDERIEH